MRLPRRTLAGVAVGAAAAFVAIRVLYRIVFGGAGSGETPLWSIPRVNLGGPFSHIVLFGPVSLEGLAAAALSALPFAGVILAVGVVVALWDPRSLVLLVPRLRAGRHLVLAFAIALSSLPFVLEVVRHTRSSALRRGVKPGRAIVVPVLEKTLERATGIARALQIRGLSPDQQSVSTGSTQRRQPPLEGVVWEGFGIPERGIATVSWHIPTGARCVLTGATGSGKTTLLEVLAGTLHHPRTVAYTGKFSSSYAPHEVAYIPHDPQSLFLTATVLDEVALGSIIGGEDRHAAREVAMLALQYWGIEHLASRHPGVLSSGEALQVALAAVTSTSPRLLLVDEPLGALSLGKRRDIVSSLQNYCDTHGASVVMTDHGHREAHDFGATIVTLHAQGITPGAFTPPSLSFPERIPVARVDPDEVFRSEAISVTFGDTVVIDEVSLSVHRGETVVIIGDNGSGKTTLLEALASSHLGPEPECALVPGEAGELFLTTSVEDELRLADRAARAPRGCTQTTLESILPGSWRGEVMARMAATHPRDLSRGQQTALAIAIQLSRKPRVLLLDEPTRGLDEAACLALGEVMECVRETGTAIVMATHDEAIAATAHHRVLMLSGGVLSRYELGVSS